MSTAFTLRRTSAAMLSLAILAAGELRAADPKDIGGMPYQREEVYEFSQAPTFRPSGKDAYEITFASKRFCDVTVAILDGEGKILRHLVSGVLGANAPEPLQKNALEQKLTWDGKDDYERYVASPQTCRLRVSLGLKPVFDKVLMWHPNRTTAYTHGLVCDKDGVYVFNAKHAPDTDTEHASANRMYLAAYDHDGNYKKTLIPISSRAVKPQAFAPVPAEGSDGMRGQGAPAEGEPLPKGRYGPPYGLVLQSGKTIITPTITGSYFDSIYPNSMTVADGIIYGVVWEEKKLRLFRIKTDGSMLDEGFYTQDLGASTGVGPSWMTVSPDRKWIYLNISGTRSRNFHRQNAWFYNIVNRKDVAGHTIHRIPFDLSRPAGAPFLGEKDEPGTDAKHFSFPEAVTCDAKGQIYVADKGNDRVQVFAEDGSLVKSLPVEAPVQAIPHPKSDAVYVLSHPGAKKLFKLIKLRGLNDPKVEATLEIKTENENIPIIPTFCLDTWGKEDTLWITGARGNVQLYADKGKDFELKRDLQQDLKKDWKGDPVNEFTFGVLAADPIHPYLYVNDSRTGAPPGRSDTSPRINTETGEIKWVPGVTSFGQDGTAYVRLGNEVRRFNPESGKPVSFDYGAGESGTLSYRFSSGDGIGFGVSPKGDIIYHDRWPPVPGLVIQGFDYSGKIPPYMLEEKWAKGKGGLLGYPVRQSYPGRIYAGSGALLQYNEFGQMVNNDVVKGIPRLASGVEMDRQGNVYVGVPMQKLVDGKELLGFSLAKFSPVGGKFVVDGKGVPVVLKDLPQRRGEFRPMGLHIKHDDAGPNGERGYGGNAWGENMAWSYGGYFAFNSVKCVCLNARFALDYFARSFVPESFRQSVAILDTNGNFILRIGGYGNADERGPDIRFAYMRYVAVTDKRLYVNDVVNRRIVSIDLKYEKEAEAELK